MTAAESRATGDEPGLLRRWLGLDLRSLALFRIGLGLILLVDIWQRSLDLEAHYTDFGVLPREALFGPFLRPDQWTIHAASGGSVWITALFIVQALVAFLFLIGWRTRLMNLFCWLLWVSLLARNPIVQQGGDLLLKCVLFWGLFCPLGSRWSVDAALNDMDGEGESGPWLGVGGIALMAQLLLLYWCTVILKLHPAWGSGQALMMALQLDLFSLPLGEALRDYPGLVYVMSYAAVSVEAVGPLLMLIPSPDRSARAWAAVLMIGFHIGIALCLAVGLFSAICAVTWLAMMPGVVWDWLDQRLRPEGPIPRLLYDAGCPVATAAAKLTLRLFGLPVAALVPVAAATADSTPDDAPGAEPPDSPSEPESESESKPESESEVHPESESESEPRSDASEPELEPLPPELLAEGARGARETGWSVVAGGTSATGHDATLALMAASPLFLRLRPLLATTPGRRIGSWLCGLASRLRGPLAEPAEALQPPHPEPELPVLRRLGQITAILVLALVIAENVRSIDLDSNFNERIKPRLGLEGRLDWTWFGPGRSLLFALGLDQKWNMFAPFPTDEDGWYVIVGTTVGGRTLDIYNRGRFVDLEGGPVRWDKPEDVSSTYVRQRWRKYLNRTWAATFSRHRVWFGRWLTRSWNRRHRGDDRLQRFDIWYVEEKTNRDGTVMPLRRHHLHHHECFAARSKE